MPALGESYDEDGYIQFSSDFVNLRFTGKQSGVTADHGLGAQAVGTQSRIIFYFSGENPLPAFYCAQPFAVTLMQDMGSGDYAAEVRVNAAVGTTVEMFVFDTVRPTPGATGDGRFELYDATGAITFSLNMIVGLFVGEININYPPAVFNGTAGTKYAVCVPCHFQRVIISDTGAPGSNRYLWNWSTPRHAINIGTGSVGSSMWTFRSTRSASGGSNVTAGIPRCLIVDVNNL